MRVQLVLPYPVSANRYWRSFVPRGHKRATVTLSDEAKAYRQEVGWLAKSAGVREPITGRINLHVELFPERPADWAKRAAKNPTGWDDDVRCIDLDNALKVLLDSLKGVVFDDDKWVRCITARRMEPDGKGARTVVEVTRAVTYSPQQELPMTDVTPQAVTSPVPNVTAGTPWMVKVGHA